MTESSINNFHQIQLTKEEAQILKLAIEEYKELFPRILEITQPKFIPTLEKYLKITLFPKKQIFQTYSLSKILKIIKEKYYEPEYEKINKLIHSITNIKLCETFTKKNFIPHCNKNCEPIHSCGNKMYILDNLNYLLCLKCQKIYHSNLVLFYCSNCKCDYYTSINLNLNNNKKENFKIATWEKYHCNAIVDDIMKCLKCKNFLYINVKNKKLTCLTCNFEFGNNINWKCIICNKEFSCDAKEYNFNESKLIKIIIKDTIFNSKNAKPDFLPCCNLGKKEILKLKFVHKKECNGNLFEGEYNKRKIIVCEKCHMLNYYENHKWMCPICEVRFLLNKKDKSEYNENENENVDNENKENINNNNYNNNNNKNYLKEEEIFNIRGINKQKRKIKNFPVIYTSFGQMKKELSQTNFKELKKLGIDEIFSSTPGIIIKNRGYSSSNLPKKIKINHSYSEREKILKNKNLSEIKDLYNINERQKIKTNNNEKEKEYEKGNSKKLSNININLNVNVNINNNSNLKIPYPYKINNNSTKNISNFNYYNQIKLSKEENKKFTSDDYNIINQIGAGTFGKIYQVENNINKKKYAMKKILANSKEDINTIESEYKMLENLIPYNLNLVKIYGIETKKLDKTTYVMYVLMDLAIRDWEKEIIQRNQRKNYYSENELFKILKELIHTFSELQKHKISHRDIKPQNILLFNNNSFKIADFGEAKNLLSNKATAQQTIRGTELYMSPILFKAIKGNYFNKYINHNPFKSDVFSLGLCFLFASTLTFNSLWDIRKIYNRDKIKFLIEKYVLKRYSNEFCNILVSMLEIDEKYRDDFVELNKKLQYL